MLVKAEADAKQAHARNDELVSERMALKAQLAESERLRNEHDSEMEYHANNIVRERDIALRELAAMTAERDAHRDRVAFLMSDPSRAAERERERAKCEAEHLALIRDEIRIRQTRAKNAETESERSYDVDTANALKAMCFRFEQHEHRPPAEPKPAKEHE